MKERLKKHFTKKKIFFALAILISMILAGIMLIDLHFKKNSIVLKDSNFGEIEYLNESLSLGKEWMLDFQKEDGFFNYIYLPSTNALAKEDNIVRQIGTFYGMLKINEYDGDENTQKAIESFRQGIQRNIRYDTISGKEIAYIEYDSIAKVNSSGMYILALSEMARQGIELSERELSDARKIIEGIYLMENSENGGLWYIYYLSKEDNKISPYGTGEALFGLISYYKYVEKEEKILEFTKKHFEKYYKISMESEFQDEPARAFYAWVLYYLLELNSIEVGQEKYIAELVNKAMRYRENNPSCKDSGCIMLPYQVGEASFMEGTSAIYPIIAKSRPDLAKEVNDYLLKSAEMLYEMQVKSVNDYENKAKVKFEGREEFLVGGFCINLQCSEIRNDYAQHVLVGFINLINSM